MENRRHATPVWSIVLLVAVGCVLVTGPLVVFLVGYLRGPNLPVESSPAPGQPAWHDGVQAGDEITDVEGTIPEIFARKLIATDGDTAEVEIIRNGDRRTIGLKDAPDNSSRHAPPCRSQSAEHGHGTRSVPTTLTSVGRVLKPRPAKTPLTSSANNEGTVDQ